jgi:hypothetical protein
MVYFFEYVHLSYVLNGRGRKEGNKTDSLCICICVCIHTYIHTYVYIYINITDEMFRDGIQKRMVYNGRNITDGFERSQKKIYIYVYICIYIYIYIHIYIYICVCVCVCAWSAGLSVCEKDRGVGWKVAIGEFTQGPKDTCISEKGRREHSYLRP